MSASIKYAYRKGHTWLYRRHYPKDVALVIDQSVFKQSLRTGDHTTARVRTVELNAHFEKTVGEARTAAEGLQGGSLGDSRELSWARSSVGNLRGRSQRSTERPVRHRKEAH